jgi:hypothetical protein
MPGKKFPDLTGDGKVTKKDILKGRGVEGFEKGGAVRVPMEPDEETMTIIESEQAEKGYSETDMEISDKGAGRVKRRGDDEEVKTYRDGGMVRGCKGIQVKGKKFSGTF